MSAATNSEPSETEGLSTQVPSGCGVEENKMGFRIYKKDFSHMRELKPGKGEVLMA